jgi:hypothetical protein
VTVRLANRYSPSLRAACPACAGTDRLQPLAGKTLGMRCHGHDRKQA